MSKPRAWVCWSSGKDSAWALHVARQQDEFEIVGLLTTITQSYNRVSMHGVRDEIVAAQADAVGLPLRRVLIPSPCSNAVYEAAMAQAVDEARRSGVTEMIFGDLFLEDVRAYRQRQLAGSGVAPRFPLWNMPTRPLAEEMIRAGVVAWVTCLDPTKVPGDLAGSKFDLGFLARLPAHVDPCAEQGEFHTCVTDGPMFRRPIAVEVGQTVRRDGFVFTDLQFPCAPSSS
jgi:uncharacterized protein (TIGR00290 family)